MADRALRVGQYAAAPGERVEALVSVDLGLAQVEVPVVLINGPRPGPRVGVTAGIHGAEYAPIRALQKVVADIDPSTMTGSLVAVIVANPAGFFGRSVYTNPIDGKNINRLFPGDSSGGPSERLAAWIFQQVIAPSDRYIDLHCGDMNEVLLPFVGYDVPLQPSNKDVVMGMAAAYGLDYILEFDGSGGVSHMAISAAGQAGIPSLIAEVGGIGQWPDDDVQRHSEGLKRALGAAGLLPPLPPPTTVPTRMGRSIWMRSPATGCFLPAVKLGQRVESGQVLGEVQDFFGRTVARVEAPFAGVFFFLVTSMSTKSGDPLLGIATEK